MNTKFFEKSPETSRRAAIEEAREAVLGESKSDAPAVLSSEEPWRIEPEILSDLDVYKSAQKSVISDLAGLLSGGEVLSDVAHRCAQAQEQEISALERAIATLESDLSIAASLMRNSIVGPETWFPSWSNNRDPVFRSSEQGLNSSINPPPAAIDPRTGMLTLPTLSSTMLYGASVPGRLRIAGVAGGDLITQVTETNGEFQPIDIKVHSKNPTGPTTSLVPWMHEDQKGVGLLLRLDLDNPGSFSRLSFCAGSRYSCEPGYLFWYPFGNEGTSNILPDGDFKSALTGGATNWATGAEFDSVKIIPASASAGPDATLRLTELGGSSAALALFTPGLAQLRPVNEGAYVENYTSTMTLYTSFVPAASGGTYRLSVLWRGLGKYISGKDSTVTVHSSGPNGVIFEQRFTLFEGLSLSRVPAAGEFSLSRYLIHVPEGAGQCYFSIQANRPGGYSDELKTSFLEVAQVNIDPFAGKRGAEKFRAPIEGLDGSFPSYVVNVEKLPEAAFFELSISQKAYEKSPDSAGEYGRLYDLSLRELSVEGIEYARSGRWTSQSRRFHGEPRRFRLIQEEDQDLSGADVRLILRPGESSYSLNAATPLLVISTEESDFSLDGTVIYYTPREETEVFEGTDLSGSVRLRYYPYANRNKMREISVTLGTSARAIKYDPNAISPLIYIEP